MPIVVWSSEHYATVEPYNSVILKSAVSGLVTDVKLLHEGSVVEEDMIIQIDNKLDKIHLKQQRKSLVLNQRILALNKGMIEHLEEQVKRLQSSYKRMNVLSSASIAQKDSAYSSFLAAQTQYISTKEKMMTLKLKIVDIEYQIALLKDRIQHKHISLEDKYLYKLLVRKGDFVSPGTPLARVEDGSRAKLILFLDAEALQGIQEKAVYIDGEKTPYRVNKVWRVADEKYISSYRVEIYIEAPKSRFSKLVKVDFK